MSAITHAQADCLRAIRDLTTPDGVPPSYDELRAHLGLSSKGAVHRLLYALQDRGMITFGAGRARNIHLVSQEPTRAQLERLDDGALRRVSSLTLNILRERAGARP